MSELKGNIASEGQLKGNMMQADGFSPTVRLEKTSEGYEFVVTDRDGEKRYLFSNATKSRISEATLLASAWEGSGNVYSQVVNIEGVTKNSQVDLTPSLEQLAIFYEKDIAFVTENDGGVVTVYVVGQKPQNDYTIQVTITEVQYE